jgi:glyoxylase-like metal-dependent hydrolase (beta-lactamase superfamily II)
MRILFTLTTLCIAYSSIAQSDYNKVQITAEQLSANVYVLYGAGGNMALVTGEQQNYLIDDQFAPLSDKILFKIKSINDKPLAYVLNTHWHGDHTGGNENLAKEGALIIASDQVYDRLKEGQQSARRNTPPAVIEALPVISFSDQMHLRYRKDAHIHAMHVNDAHTDGDSFYYFPEENVIHMGDNFSNAKYPFIDLSSGGDIDGLLSNLNMAQAMLNDDSKIIPGHGPAAALKDLKAYTHVLETCVELLRELRDQGLTVEEILAENPLAEWNDRYGDGFIGPEAFIRSVLESLD